MWRVLKAANHAGDNSPEQVLTPELVHALDSYHRAKDYAQVVRNLKTSKVRLRIQSIPTEHIRYLFGKLPIVYEVPTFKGQGTCVRRAAGYCVFLLDTLHSSTCTYHRKFNIRDHDTVGGGVIHPGSTTVVVRGGAKLNILGRGFFNQRSVRVYERAGDSFLGQFGNPRRERFNLAVNSSGVTPLPLSQAV